MISTETYVVCCSLSLPEVSAGLCMCYWNVLGEQLDQTHTPANYTRPANKKKKNTSSVCVHEATNELLRHYCYDFYWKSGLTSSPEHSCFSPRMYSENRLCNVLIVCVKGGGMGFTMQYSFLLSWLAGITQHVSTSLQHFRNILPLA